MLPEEFYSNNAIRTYEKLYLKRNENDDIVENISQCHQRISNFLAEDEFEEYQFQRLLDEQKFRPNTPCMANAGIKNDSILHACFVKNLSDDMDSIIEMWTTASKIYEGGGGMGVPITNLRREGSPLSSGGQASGPLSYLDVIESISHTIKSGGKQRRAANKVDFRYDHPDVFKLINCKRDKQSYKTMNMSVAVDDSFMHKVSVFVHTEGLSSTTVNVIDPNEGNIETYAVKDIWNNIINSAWECADPGLFFLTETNKDNPLQETLGNIECTNPCFPGDTKVWTVYGPKTFKELADKGEDIPVLSQNSEGFLEVKTMRNPRLSRRRKQNLIRIHFDDSEYQDCTPDHSWYVRTKEGIKKVQAKDLKSGDSISSVYRYNANQRKRKRLTNGIEDPLQHHVHVAWKEGRRPEYPFEHCHHKDNNITNDVPDNLEILSASEHNAMNMFGKDNPTCKYGSPIKGKGYLIEGNKNPHYYHHITKEMILNLKEQGFNKKQICEKLDCSKKVIRNRLNEPNNHKVACIEHLSEKKFVYNGTVDDNHNFFIHIGDDDGVLVANCSEVPLSPDSACDLGHFNLIAYSDENGDIDWDLFINDIYWAVLFLNRMIDKSAYPSSKFEENMKKFRPIGLGLMGFADLLYKRGIRYGSEDSIDLLGVLTRTLTENAFACSSQLVEQGKIPSLAENLTIADTNKFNEIINSYTPNTNINNLPGNCTVTCLAPTGSTAMSADCSYAFEPIFGLIWIKQMDGGETMEFLNPYFEKALNEKGYHSNFKNLLFQDIKKNKGSIQGLDYLPDDLKEIFVTAHDISNEERIQMQSEAQKHITMAISSTVNLPNNATPEDIGDVYLKAWKAGLKGITVYRDGCLEDQPVNFGGEEKSEEIVETTTHEKKERPKTLYGFTEKMKTGSGDLFLTINEINKSPFEVFATLGKSGRSAAAKAEAIGRLVSLCLRSNVNIQEIVKQLDGIGGDYQIFQNGGLVKSIPDAVAKILKEKYLEGHDTSDNYNEATPTEEANYIDPKTICPECGQPTLRHDAGCRGGLCTSCGYSNCE